MLSSSGDGGVLSTCAGLVQVGHEGCKYIDCCCCLGECLSCFTVSLILAVLCHEELLEVFLVVPISSNRSLVHLSWYICHFLVVACCSVP